MSNRSNLKNNIGMLPNLLFDIFHQDMKHLKKVLDTLLRFMPESTWGVRIKTHNKKHNFFVILIIHYVTSLTFPNCVLHNNNTMYG